MVQGPPSSDSEDIDDGALEALEYQYESEGEEALARSARSLLREADGSYRCKLFPVLHYLTLNGPLVARAALLAYTR